MRMTLAALDLSPPCLPLASVALSSQSTFAIAIAIAIAIACSTTTQNHHSTSPNRSSIPVQNAPSLTFFRPATASFRFVSWARIALRRISQCARSGTGYGADVTPLRTFRGLLLRRFSFCEVEVQNSVVEDAAPCGVVREEMMVHGDNTDRAWRY